MQSRCIENLCTNLKLVPLRTLTNEPLVCLLTWHSALLFKLTVLRRVVWILPLELYQLKSGLSSCMTLEFDISPVIKTHMHAQNYCFLYGREKMHNQSAMSKYYTRVRLIFHWTKVMFFNFSCHFYYPFKYKRRSIKYPSLAVCYGYVPIISCHLAFSHGYCNSRQAW